MNSSANQISPISHRRDVPSRVAKFLPTWQVFPDAFGKSRPRPPPAGNMPSTACFTQGGMLGIGPSERLADSPIVELHKRPINRFAGGCRRPRRAAWKAAINGVSTQSCVFTKNLRLRPMLGYFALGSDRSLGIPERQPHDRQIDQATGSVEHLVAALRPRTADAAHRGIPALPA